MIYAAEIAYPNSSERAGLPRENRFGRSMLNTRVTRHQNQSVIIALTVFRTNKVLCTPDTDIIPQ